MTETDALTVLRSLVAQFNEDEKLALAAFLTLKSATHVKSLVLQPAGSLKQAFEASTKFPRTAKLSFAIELLKLQIDLDESEEEDKGDGLPDPSDHEEKEYYNSDKSLFGRYDGDVDIDSLPRWTREAY